MNLIGLLSSLLIGLSWADAPSSAMVSDAELKVLTNLPIKKDASQPTLKKGEWRLDGIILTSQTDWTVWLNGQRYTPTSLPDDIIINNITATSLDLCFDGQPAKQVALGQVVNTNYEN